MQPDAAAPTPPSPTAHLPGLRPAPVFVHARGEWQLLMPLRDGFAELDAMVALRGNAAELWRVLCSGGGEAEMVAALAPHADDPAADVARFLADLRWAGLVEGPAGEGARPRAAPGRAYEEGRPDVTLGPAGVLDVARAVLGAGHGLRFAARGHSMRPWIPHGAVLEVAPRAPAAVRRGDVLLYAAGEQVVAHRVLRLEGSTFVTRGDSAARVDRVAPEHVLGVVVARLAAGPHGARRVALDGILPRLLGRASSALHRTSRGALRLLVVAPLRRFAPWRRAVLRGARLVSRLLAAGERRRARWRRKVDVAIAALMTTAEKDAERRTLYARHSVRAFTALDENVEAGLTLIEEVMLARHPLPDGPVLVLGCGPGRECVALARDGRQVVGLDRDPGMLDLARALAAREGVALELVSGEADAFDLGGRRFAAVLALSGLYNMLLPRARRIALLRCAAAHLADGGRIYVTFLSDYVPRGAPPPPRVRGLGSAINPDHEHGDLWLRNEAVHVFPHGGDLAREAHEAGLSCVALFRDQRAYDRETRQVRGFAVLQRVP